MAKEQEPSLREIAIGLGVDLNARAFLTCPPLRIPGLEGVEVREGKTVKFQWKTIFEKTAAISCTDRELGSADRNDEGK